MISTFRTSDFRISGSAISSHKNIQIGANLLFAAEERSRKPDLKGVGVYEQRKDQKTEFISIWYCNSHKYFCVIYIYHSGTLNGVFSEENTLLVFDWDCRNLSVYHPSERIHRILKRIADSGGLFWRRSES